MLLGTGVRQNVWDKSLRQNDEATCKEWKFQKPKYTPWLRTQGSPPLQVDVKYKVKMKYLFHLPRKENIKCFILKKVFNDIKGNKTKGEIKNNFNQTKTPRTPNHFWIRWLYRLCVLERIYCILYKKCPVKFISWSISKLFLPVYSKSDN